MMATTDHPHQSPDVERLAEIAKQASRPPSRRTSAAPCLAEYTTAVARLADMVDADELLAEVHQLAGE